MEVSRAQVLTGGDVEVCVFFYGGCYIAKDHLSSENSARTYSSISPRMPYTSVHALCAYSSTLLCSSILLRFPLLAPFGTANATFYYLNYYTITLRTLLSFWLMFWLGLVSLS